MRLDAIDQYFVPRAGVEGILPDGQVGAGDFRALIPALHFADGLIAKAYNSFDFLSFFEGVGLFPQESFLLLLSGDKLG